MQDLSSDGAKETRQALAELFDRISYHPHRRSPQELASDAVRELARKGLLREDGAEEASDEPMPAWDPNAWVKEGDRLKAEHEAWLDEHPEADGMI